MAHYAHKVTASWMSTAFGDVTELRVTHGGAAPQARSAYWSLDAGSIDVFSLCTAALSMSSWGKKGVIAIGGTAVDRTATTTVITIGFTAKAICTQLQASAKANDVWRYQGTFKIVQE